MPGVSPEMPAFGAEARKQPAVGVHAEVAAFADGIRALLDDPGADLSPSRRMRWEGAPTALDYVLGRSRSLIDEETGPVRPLKGRKRRTPRVRLPTVFYLCRVC
jgi:hypothetical protein